MRVLVMPGAVQFDLSHTTLNSDSTREIRVTGVQGTNCVVLEKSQDLISWSPVQTNAPMVDLWCFAMQPQWLGNVGFTGQYSGIEQLPSRGNNARGSTKTATVSLAPPNQFSV